MFPYNLQGDKEIYSDFPFTLKIHHLHASVPAHVHQFIEFTYVIEGTGIEKINGVEKQLTPGTFTLVFPHQVHELAIQEGDELRLYVGAIGLKAFFGAGESLLALHSLLKGAEGDKNTTYHLDSSTSNRIHLLLQDMYEEMQEHKPWSRMIYLAKLTELFVWFDRYRIAHLNEGSHIEDDHLRRGMWEVVYYVYQNFKEEITLEFLSKTYNYSSSYISTAFKQLVGENYYSFLERIRIAHACNLLISTDMKITDVAYEAGFRSYPTFIRVFQNRMEMSPTTYRRKNHIALLSS
ncbi:AraC family transcriptional regulator [Paenibacillus alvei]|uniref:AraC family transcriptional regulator n=1 Tax=Paenibacillus alvei TaxID=44250 RepID=UPI0018CE92CD|nr:AraC family transcriptional regulator [Paenibacillus alvei]MBG9735571.1 AraC family transcriptional regulator [Paenibacillus alvei]MBG9746698.1 AraC family transcriptional regulator [Paenibacillus alvei]MCY9578476.1 AraC family transcriptional regulator [Paenibacillus alvei]MCY9584797.1 AraC family transcriptional regulator [Paenibacillus alvei]